jgi:uncharacterized protein (TIGR02266 family)
MVDRTDQRRHERVDVVLRVKLRFADVNRFRVFTTKNLSEGGVFVVCTRPPPPGSWVQVVLYPPGIELGLPIYGTVVHSVPVGEAHELGTNPGMGVRFEDLDEDARESITNLVHALRESVPAAIPPPPPEMVFPPALPPELPPRPAGEERRTSERIQARTAVRLRFTDNRVFREFYTKDLSRGGVFVCTAQPLAVGSDIEILLTPPDGKGELHLEGRVVRSVAPTADAQVTAGMGIEFTDLTLEKRTEISRYFEEVAETRANLGRVRRVASAHLRYEATEFARVVRSELRRRLLFVPGEAQRAPGSSVNVFLHAPQLEAPIELSGEVESSVTPEMAALHGDRVGMFVRLTDLTDEKLADVELALRPSAPRPGSAPGREKAAMLAEAALEDWKAGRQSSAVSNLKLALTFDPTNEQCRGLLDQILGKGS